MAVNMQESLFSEVAAFIVSQPNLEAIADYQASAAAQERLEWLLEKNREIGLRDEEHEEMDHFQTLSHLMSMAKAKARLMLAGKA